MAAATPSLTSRPEKTINGFLCKWNASELPIVYEIANTKWPTNSGDSNETVNSVADNGGYAQFTLNSATSLVAKDFITMNVGVYQGIVKIRSVESTTLITVDSAYISDDSGTIIKYYNNYTTRIEIYVGINEAHTLSAQDPYELISTVDQIPDSDNNTIIDIHKYVKSKLSPIYLESGNDINSWKDFYIKFAETYDQVSAGIISEFVSEYTTDSSEWCHATYSALQFGNARGGNMYNYVIAVTKTDKGQWLTDFVKQKINSNDSISTSIILDSGSDLYGTLFKISLKYYDINGVLQRESNSDITNEGYGLYRLPVILSAASQTTKSILFQIELDEVVLSETLEINADLECADIIDAPTNLVATAVSDSQINLTWTLGGGGTGVDIYRGTVSGSLTLLISQPAGTEAYNDTTVSDSTEYFYHVIETGAIDSAPSNEASASTLFSFSFQTNMAAGGTFDPTCGYSGADTPFWLFEDGSIETGASISVLGSSVGLDGTTQEVKLLAVDKSAFSLFQASTDSLVGDIDFSVFVGATFTDIQLFSNSLVNIDITGITTDSCHFTAYSQSSLLTIAVDSGQEFNRFEAYSCANLTDITGLSTIDIVGVSARLDLRNCTSLTSETIPSTITATSVNKLSMTNTPYNQALDMSGWGDWIPGSFLELNNCGITSISMPSSMITGSIFILRLQQNGWSSIDLSKIVCAASEIFLNDCTSMTTVTNPTGTIGTYQIHGCTSLTSLDKSTFSWVNGVFDDEFDANGCSVLATLTNCSSYATGVLREWSIENTIITDPKFDTITSGTFDLNNVVLNFSNLGMTAAQVNQALVELDGICSSTGTGKVATLTGSNAAPDGSSGGYDGDAAVASLVSKNWTVNTN